MIQTTVLHPKHLEAGAKMVDFHGWEMPINYGSQLEEHHAVRTDAGMFDVSHMTIVDLTGERVKAFPCNTCWPTTWPNSPSPARPLQRHAQSGRRRHR